MPLHAAVGLAIAERYDARCASVAADTGEAYRALVRDRFAPALGALIPTMAVNGYHLIWHKPDSQWRMDFGISCPDWRKHEEAIRATLETWSLPNVADAWIPFSNDAAVYGGARGAELTRVAFESLSRLAVAVCVDETDEDLGRWLGTGGLHGQWTHYLHSQLGMHNEQEAEWTFGRGLNWLLQLQGSNPEWTRRVVARVAGALGGFGRQQ